MPRVVADPGPGNCIAVQQQKTDRRLTIPMHPELVRALEAAPKTEV
jgi:hypothetical protein